MKAIYFDAKTGTEIPAHSVSGITGFVSWRRLAEIFRAAHEVKSFEDLVSYQIDDRGITFRVEV
jgi:hypothetical protein